MCLVLVLVGVRLLGSGYRANFTFTCITSPLTRLGTEQRGVAGSLASHSV